MFKQFKPFKPPPLSTPGARGGGQRKGLNRAKRLNGFNVWNSRVENAKAPKVERL